jgi:isopenicillin N synthase-like dioxygenase
MTTLSDVPVVDLTGFDTASPDEAATIARRIRAVSTELGFLYLAGTEISAPIVDELFRQSATFFALPGAQKMAFTTPLRLDDRLNAGYVPQGREHEDQATPSDIKEAFDLFLTGGYNADAFAPATGEPPAPEVAPLLAAFGAYHARCTRVARTILRAFAIGYGLPEDYFVTRHGGNNMLRLLHYPPVPADAPANAVRVGAHTDFGTLTILVQDPSGGLEVLAADGRWLYAPSIPGAVLVNIGDLMQQWTNDEFRSTLHRVAVPPDARAARSRYSVAFFCEPNSDTEIACLPCARNSDTPLFAPVLAGEHMRARLNQTLIAKT